MKKNTLISIALLSLAASAAVAQDVRYNFDKDTDFSKLKTFKWVTIKDASKLDDLRDKQIKDAVEAELAKKGLTNTEADTADLYVGYQAGIGTEKQFTSYNTGWGYGQVGTGAVGTGAVGTEVEVCGTEVGAG